MSGVPLLRRGIAASSAVVNAWQSMVQVGHDREQREALGPGRHPEGEGNWLEPVAVAECWELLAAARVGRIGFTAHSGRPVILPVNFVVTDRTIAIRSGRGPKLAAADRGDVVAFEVDEIDAATQTGWSVAVTGRARRVHEPAELARLDGLDHAAWAAGPREQWIVITPIHVGGRRLVVPGG